MRSRQVLWSEMAEIAVSAGDVQQRAQALLAPLSRVVPYAAACFAWNVPSRPVSP